MKFFILLSVIVPCIWALNNSDIQCPDGGYCPKGKTCCLESDQYNCCDISEDEKKNKKLITAFPSHFNKNDSTDYFDNDGICSNGTSCQGNWCCKYEKAACCGNSTSCCPENYQCCGTAASPPHIWCCKKNQRCAASYFYCVAGANSISSTFLSLIMMLVVAVSLKHF